MKSRFLILTSILAVSGLTLLVRCFAPAGAQPPSEKLRATERSGTPSGMVYVPGSDCLLGTIDPGADEDVQPQRRVFVASFYMDRLEVTNAEFRRFRVSHTFPIGEDDLPVTNVTYDEAAAYAKWAGKRLPTEEEWEKAARGTDGRRYPWGNTWNAAFVAARAKGDKKAPLPMSKSLAACSLPGVSRVRKVGSVPAGESPYGCLDMAGNAWEWVQGYYNDNPEQRILRGGAVGYGERAFRTYNRAIEGAGDT